MAQLAQRALSDDIDNTAASGPICLAFSGAGLHGFYFNGVCRYIQEQDIEVKEAWGSSAGALAALSVLMRVGEEAYEHVFTAYDSNGAHIPWMFWHGRGFIWEGPGGGLRRFIPTGAEAEAAWLNEVVNGRLHIVVTRLMGWRFKRVVVSHWTSVEDLLGCVTATMTIPGITAVKPYWWRGGLWLDGGFVDQHPSTDKAVLVSTSLPVQPWAASWHRHIDIFRPFPIRQSWWHSPVSERRDMFKLGYMDAKTYFETQLTEPKLAKPLKPKVRALSFVTKLALELIQGSFMLALTARFVWRRQELWRAFHRRPLGSALTPLITALFTVFSAQHGKQTTRWLARFGAVGELGTLGVVSLFLWCTTVDLRLDLSEYLLDLVSTREKKALIRAPSSRQMVQDGSDAGKTDHASTRDVMRRPRSLPCRARRARS